MCTLQTTAETNIGDVSPLSDFKSKDVAKKTKTDGKEAESNYSCFYLINKMNTVIPDTFLLDFYVQRMFDACSAVYEAFLF